MDSLQGVFSFVRTHALKGYPKYEENYLRHLQAVAQKWQLLRPVLWPFERGGGRQADILFVGTKFLDLALSVRQWAKVGVVVAGKKDLKRCLRSRIGWFPAWKWLAGLLASYELEADSPEQYESLKKIVKDMERRLRAISPRVLVFSNDSLFLERALILASRNLGIPSVTIQHGIIQKASPSFILDGQFTDYMMVWGEFFRDMYLDRGIIAENRVIVLGYPFAKHVGRSQTDVTQQAEKTVCILGQPFDLYDDEWTSPMASVIRNNVRACEEAEMTMVYRPHPAESRERLQFNFPKLSLTPAGESLEEAIRKYRVFVSVNSTALVEVTLNEKIALQIREQGIPHDDFQALGISYSVDNEVGKIRDFFLDVKFGNISRMPLNSEYISTTSDTGRSFMQTLEAIGA